MKNGEVCYRLSFSNEGIVLRKMSFLEPLHYLCYTKSGSAKQPYNEDHGQ